MDLNPIIDQHLQWKTKVEKYLNESDATSISQDVFIADDQCELGQWLITEEAKSCLSKEFLNEITGIHKEFHYITKTIINSFQAGYTDSAKELLSEYTQYSDQLVLKLQQINKEINS